MKTKSNITKKLSAKAFEKLFDDGKDDVLKYFDTDEPQVRIPSRKVNVDFPTWVINALDREAQRIGVPRQALIKLWIVERLERVEESA